MELEVKHRHPDRLYGIVLQSGNAAVAPFNKIAVTGQSGTPVEVPVDTPVSLNGKAEFLYYRLPSDTESVTISFVRDGEQKTETHRIPQPEPKGRPR